MSSGDFEITVRLWAQRLLVHVPPDTETHREGEEVRLERQEKRDGLGPKTRAGARHSNVVVEKRLVGDAHLRAAMHEK